MKRIYAVLKNAFLEGLPVILGVILVVMVIVGTQLIEENNDLGIMLFGVAFGIIATFMILLDSEKRRSYKSRKRHKKK